MPEFPKEFDPAHLDFRADDPTDLAAGDHFVGMPDGEAMRRQRVLNEIADDIEAGSAHLMTRNELVEFMQWWVDRSGDDNANAMIYEAMENSQAVRLDSERVQTLAKAFFVEKGYESA